MAGIIAGTGRLLNRLLPGHRPEVTLISLKISDETGMAYESDTVAAMQWVFDNKDAYNIRVVNLSINSTTEQSYHDSPMNAAAEILWFNGIVVVASSGNRSEDWSWNTINTAPANDPFIITVGASHENGDADRRNDYMALFHSQRHHHRWLQKAGSDGAGQGYLQRPFQLVLYGMLNIPIAVF